MDKKSLKKTRHNLYLGQDQVDQLKKISDKTLVPMSRLVRKFIDDGLKKYSK